MTRFSPITFVFLIAGSVALAAQDSGSRTQEVLARTTEASVYVKTQRIFKYERFPSSGSGFFIHPDGYVLTNWHVVADQIKGSLWGEEREINAKVLSLTVVIDSGTALEREFQAKIVARDRGRDLALLKVQHAPTSILDFNDISTVALGEKVWVAGFPFGDLLSRERKETIQDEVNPAVTVTSGTVTSLRRDTAGHIAMVQTDAAINPGNSGGPMVNTDGQLVGVVFAGIRGGEGLGFGISPYRIREFLKHQAIKISFSPRTILSPPQPINVSVKPILTALDIKKGEVCLEGDDIPSVTVQLAPMGSTLSATIDFPERLAGIPRPARYIATLRLFSSSSPKPLERRFALDAVPESMDPLYSAREPGRMLEDRKFFAHEMEIKDFAKDQQVGGGEGNRRSLADAGRSVKLNRSPDGSVIIDNRAVVEIGGTQEHRDRYRFLTDPNMERAAREYDGVVRQLKVLQEAQRGGRYSFSSYERQQILRKRRMEVAATLRAHDVVLCQTPSFFVTRSKAKNHSSYCSNWQSIN